MRDEGVGQGRKGQHQKQTLQPCCRTGERHPGGPIEADASQREQRLYQGHTQCHDHGKVAQFWNHDPGLIPIRFRLGAV